MAARTTWQGSGTYEPCQPAHSYWVIGAAAQFQEMIAENEKAQIAERTRRGPAGWIHNRPRDCLLKPFFSLVAGVESDPSVAPPDTLGSSIKSGLLLCLVTITGTVSTGHV